MGSRCCPRARVCMCIPLWLLGNGSVRFPTTSYVYYEIALHGTALPRGEPCSAVMLVRLPTSFLFITYLFITYLFVTYLFITYLLFIIFINVVCVIYLVYSFYLSYCFIFNFVFENYFISYLF
jgi:hypothetical protein